MTRSTKIMQIIGVGVKKARNKDSEDDDDSEDMNGIDEMSNTCTYCTRREEERAKEAYLVDIDWLDMYVIY